MKKMLIMLILILVIASLTNAEAIEGLFDTGVDDLGQVLPIDTLELHYVMSGPDAPAYIVPEDPDWVVAPEGSRWIGPYGAWIGVGYNSYTLTFDLSNLDPNDAIISGIWSSDNSAEIILNGVSTGISTDWLDFDQLFYFTINKGFIDGQNTLEFKVHNAYGPEVNPSGLLVADLQGYASPKNCYSRPRADLNYDCKVDLLDFAMMAEDWLIDCNLTPDDPACIPK